jgi:hypothetical protein
MEDHIKPGWRTSSYTGNGGGNCVEVADQAARVLVRDTKDRTGPVLRFTPAVWLRFADEVKRSLAPAPNRGPADAGRGTRVLAVDAGVAQLSRLLRFRAPAATPWNMAGHVRSPHERGLSGHRAGRRCVERTT